MQNKGLINELQRPIEASNTTSINPQSTPTQPVGNKYLEKMNKTTGT